MILHFLTSGSESSVSKALAHCTAENLKIRNIGWVLSAEVLIIFGG